MNKPLLISLIVAGVIIVSYVAIKLLPASSDANNRSKLERTFTTEEQRLIDTNKISYEELAKFNGQGYNKPYVAVNGVVYDLSSIQSWKNGQHHGVRAGADATDKFMKSGHGRSILQKLPVIGGLK
jgi:cytochrome b5